MAKKFSDIYEKIINYGIIPAIKIDEIHEIDNAVDAAKALNAGRLNIAEITFKTNKSELAEKTLKKISAALPDMLLAAGDIETLKQAKAAVGSGAKIILSHGFAANSEIASYCEKNNIVLIPKCPDASLDGLNALADKYPDVMFIPSGGQITEDNLSDYLSNKSVAACCVDFIAKNEYITDGDFDKIRDSAVSAVYKMLRFNLAHVVINCENTEQAERDAGKIESIFGLKKTDAGTSVTNADILHFTKSRSYGKNGQIAISTNFIDRAVFYLKETKKDFIDESARYDGDGDLTSIYLDSLIGGFALKLVRK